MKTRNWLWHEPRPEKLAEKIAKDVLKKNKDFRRAKRSCPACKSKALVVRERKPTPSDPCRGVMWCICCGMMVPFDSVYSIKTGRKVKF